MKRMLLGGVLGIAALLILAGAAGFYWLSTSLPEWSGRQRVQGLGAPVDIVRDTRGVPRIFAQSDEDAAFALGFAHAQDRLWQMEGMRRLGAGRLAEVIGPAGLRSDRFMRVLGFSGLAEEQFANLDAPVRAVLEAYAAGVNAWLKTRPGALPPEFLALGLEPEPWHPVHSLLWAKIMAVRLSGNRRDEILRARLTGRLAPEKIAEFWPPYPADGPVTLTTLDRLKGTYRDLDLDRLAAAEPGPGAMPHGASNAWAVAGARTVSGKPILANDPHLGFSAPILWYLARLVTPGLDLAGATVPGVPFMILGHNRHIAWGITSTHSDLEDLFLERPDPADGSRYLTPDGTQPFSVREEVIRVRGGEDEILTVRATRHGPVLSDLLGAMPGHTGHGGAKTVLALAATFLAENDRTPQALYWVNRARDWSSFVAALEDFHAPQENIVYADVAGNIGFLAPGRVPVRRGGRGRVPMPGWTGEADWEGFVPYPALPRALNPPAGLFINANNKVVGDDYPYFIGEDWAAPYRAQRIRKLLDAVGPHSLESTAAIQLDIVSLMARSLLPLMLDVEPVSERERQALDMMKTWDHVMSRHRPEPLIFAAWLRHLASAIYADELGPLFAGYWSFKPRFVSMVLTEKPAWCDDVRTKFPEDCKSRVELALRRALDDLSGRLGEDMLTWRWGDIHKARFRHALSADLPVIGGIADLVIESDGGSHTVNRADMRIASPDRPFEHIHGSGLRAIYDLSDLERSRFMIATGQSGNPLSGHYGDLVEGWRDGRAMTLGQTRAELQSEGARVFSLVPE